jgi:hypothetical protein
MGKDMNKTLTVKVTMFTNDSNAPSGRLPKKNCWGDRMSIHLEKNDYHGVSNVGGGGEDYASFENIGEAIRKCLLPAGVRIVEESPHIKRGGARAKTKRRNSHLRPVA